jgi:hypothetical protein
MTLERRVTAVETSLSPTQLVLRWLAEAHAFGNLEAYVGSLLDLPGSAQPIDRLCRQTERGVKASLRGKRPEVVDAAVRSALRETVFRFELVMRINVAANDLLDREVLCETIFALQLAVLMNDQSKGRLAAESHQHRVGQCRDLAVLSVNELLATQEARSTVEARYLDGHPALFPDTAAAFNAQLRASQEVAATARSLAGLDGVPPTEPCDPEAVTARASQLVDDLVEPARSTALEKLGEVRLAFDIAKAWLRSKLAVAPLQVPEP